MFKVGDIVRIREDLVDGEMYGKMIYTPPYHNLPGSGPYEIKRFSPITKLISFIGGTPGIGNNHWHAPEMLVLVEETELLEINETELLDFLNE